VLRTLWPLAAGTGRWATRYGETLVCVRHREDPLGLRRVVTVELVVAAVRGWPGDGPVLKPNVIYALRLPPRHPTLRRSVLAHGGWPETDSGRWCLRGEAIRKLKLQDWLTSLAPFRPSAPPDGN
jgi:hypothetical protein